MWAVRNDTDFAVERGFVRDRDGGEVWLVAVRATYQIQPGGGLELAPDQDPVVLAPRFTGEPPHSSLRYDGDLVRTKAGTDVILHGNAHAPANRPVGTVEASLQLGTLHKRLNVHGDRVWERAARGLVPSKPEPFLTRTIAYELAHGGPLGDTAEAGLDPLNPAGIGRIDREGEPVPAIETPEAPVLAVTSTAPPAGFGPIASHWQPRAKLAGTYDAAWQESRQPLPPTDFNDGFYRCAPVDQQVQGFLQGGEEVVLGNLTPSGMLRFRLPRVSLGFRTRIDGGTTHHRGQLHTVIIEPEEPRLILVWQTALPCHHTLYSLKETIVFEKQRNPLGNHSESQPAVMS